MGIGSTKGPGGRPPVHSANWQETERARSHARRGEATRVEPELPPVRETAVNQFQPLPQPMEDEPSALRTSPGTRVRSTAMLPPGADEVLASGAAQPVVCGALARAIDSLDPDVPVPALDATLLAILDAHYRHDGDRSATVSRMLEAAFA